ncbi:MAG: hypothetical protein AAF911_09410 [Planctomycetota bacterium]
MLELLKLLFDWKDLFNFAGFDAVIYAAFALLGTAIFIIRMGLMMLFGADSDFDLDLDSPGEAGGYGLISVLSITAFLMGCGWMGVISQVMLEWSSIASATLALPSGFVLMLVAASMMLVLRKAAHNVEYDPAEAVGHVGTVYMSIPAQGEGNGKVRVPVQGRTVIVDAVSAGPAIESFKDVKVVQARDEKTLIVEPA